MPASANPDTTMVPKLETDVAHTATTRGKCPASEITCYRCSGKGHYKANCPSPKDVTVLALEEVPDGVW